MWWVRFKIYEKEVNYDDFMVFGLCNCKDGVVFNKDGEDCGKVGL